VQDPNGDGDNATSDGIAVIAATSQVKIGGLVWIEGTVTEQSSGQHNLSLTTIAPAVMAKTGDGALPAPVVIGQGGRQLPKESIGDGPEAAIRILESLEGMYVTVNNAQVVGPTNHFKEGWVLPDDGSGASGLNSWGGITATPGDFNPERVKVDLEKSGATPDDLLLNIGDRISSITGALGYSFGNYEIVASKMGSVTRGALPAVVPPDSSADDLTVATYNVENLDTQIEDAHLVYAKKDVDDDVGNGRFAKIAGNIVDALGAPDIVALQEIQDNDGAQASDVIASDKTLKALTDAITTAGGPTYQFIVKDPVDDMEGGEPGGNIRVAILYKPDRVAPDANRVTRIYDPSFASTRLPLAVPFAFHGKEVFIIDVHLSSKGGSDPLYGTVQPPADGTIGARSRQARAIREFVRSLPADPDRVVTILGDFNTLFDEAPLQILTGGEPGFENLTLRDAPFERFSYVFEGNGEALDHILVDTAHAKQAKFAVLHVNSLYPEDVQASDHDPKVMVLSQ
jgi:uncharacterized protein